MTFKSLIALAAATATLASIASIATAGAWTKVKSDQGYVLASDKNDMTLYTFTKDGKSKSNCYGDCATAWPPFYAGKGDKATGDYGITVRKDGKRQWTLKGKPLYFWAGDTKPGDITGHGVGGVWYAVFLDGGKASKKSNSTYKY
jgi:predicted lipoprotein with Yx(FWY)xxD motif